MAKASGQIETELKLRFDPEDLPILESLPLLSQNARGPEVLELCSRYFDTPERDLIRNGLELRLRRGERPGWIQTIKSRNGEGAPGLFERGEIEQRIEGPGLDLDQLPRKQMPSLLRKERIRRRLTPMFETRVRRRRYDLDFDDGLVELVIDTGQVSAGEESIPLSEVELELKRGRPELLFELAGRLAESLDLRPQTMGKADLGYQLIVNEPAAPRSAALPPLSKDMPLEEAMEKILREALRQIRHNERVILESDDPEGVHQMRVGLRRLRSCLYIFSTRLPKGVVAPVKEMLRPILDALGPARDWDVFLEERLEPMLRENPEASHLAALAGAAERQRAAAYANLREEIESRDYSRTLLRLTTWIRCRQWREGMTAKQIRRLQDPIGPFARKAMARGRRRLLRRGKHLAMAEDTAWHELRIAIKKQRYFTGALRGCFPGKRFRRYAKWLGRLQNQLGLINDLATAGRLLDEIAAEESAAEFAAMAEIAKAWQAREYALRRKAFLQEWKRFRNRYS